MEFIPYLTAPNNAPSHSALRESTVLSGSADPVALKVSNPASRSTKENFRFRDAGRDSRILFPAYINQPIPYPSANIFQRTWGGQ